MMGIARIDLSGVWPYDVTVAMKRRLAQRYRRTSKRAASAGRTEVVVILLEV